MEKTALISTALANFVAQLREIGSISHVTVTLYGDIENMDHTLPYLTLPSYSVNKPNELHYQESFPDLAIATTLMIVAPF